MNSEEIQLKTEMSSFFFENKLYEFSQKKLKDFDREAMKKFTTTSPEAKYKIGTVLLSLEYLEKINAVEMDIDKGEVLAAAKRKERISKAVNFIFFVLLTACFFGSGYIFLSKHYEGNLF